MEQVILLKMGREEFESILSSIFRKEIEGSTPFNEEVEKEFLTSEDLMKLLKVTAPTLNKLRKSGLIPYYRIGSMIRFEKTEVMDALKNSKTKSLKK